MKLASTFTLLFALIFSTGVNAQDAKAKAILDGLSKKTKAYSSIKADFSYTLENKDQNINESQAGTIYIKGPKYKLNIAGQEVISDGTTMWTYLKDAGECQVQNAPDESQEDAISPSNIFTIYEKGFKYKYEGEKTSSGKTLQNISLFPTDPKDKPYHTVRLFIDKAAQQIHSIEVIGKDGNKYTYLVKTFTPNVNVNESMFTFNPSQHPKVDVIDLRD